MNYVIDFPVSRARCTISSTLEVQRTRRNAVLCLSRGGGNSSKTRWREAIPQSVIWKLRFNFFSKVFPWSKVRKKCRFLDDEGPTVPSPRLASPRLVSGIFPNIDRGVQATFVFPEYFDAVKCVQSVFRHASRQPIASRSKMFDEAFTAADAAVFKLSRAPRARPVKYSFNLDYLGLSLSLSLSLSATIKFSTLSSKVFPPPFVTVVCWSNIDWTSGTI